MTGNRKKSQIVKASSSMKKSIHDNNKIIQQQQQRSGKKSIGKRGASRKVIAMPWDPENTENANDTNVEMNHSKEQPLVNDARRSNKRLRKTTRQSYVENDDDDDDDHDHSSVVHEDAYDSDESSNFTADNQENRSKKRSNNKKKKNPSLDDTKSKVQKKNTSRKPCTISSISTANRTNIAATVATKSDWKESNTTRVKVSLSPSSRNLTEEENTFGLDRDWRVVSALDY